MNEADKAIEEIRAVRHSISARHGHDIGKYLDSLRVEEKQNEAQLTRGQELLAHRKTEQRKYQVVAGQLIVLRDRPEKRTSG
jgi:hypothetical protein